ncbi:MAG: type I-PGING CRISPR-associated protein Cas7/Csp1 [Bacteroidota bacterium]
MKTIKSILVTAVCPFSDHAANRGEKLLGNASSVKRRPDGRAYLSGQMQRHVLFSAIDRLNATDPNREDTYVANGDGISADISKDLRSDLGGFLITNKGDYSGRRISPISATPAVAGKSSQIGHDLLVRLKLNPNKDAGRKQALATNEFSQSDDMVMNFHLDVGAVGVTKQFEYSKQEAHVATHYEQHIDDDEHARRIRLFLEATRTMNDYANQARNAVSGEPRQVLIVLDPGMSRKAIRYFNDDTDQVERQHILQELEARGAQYFIGDDTSQSGDSVYEAYQKAQTALVNNQLYRPL